MVEEFTKEQKAQLKTWAEQRDELLLSISKLREEEEKLQTINKETANSNTDIINRAYLIEGRIEELNKKESELPKVISKEVAFLESKKTVLESEIINLGKIINILTPQKTELEYDIEKAFKNFNIIKGESLLLEKVTDKVTTISKDNTDKINLLVSDLAKSLKEIIAVNKKNVDETNIVIDKVPKMIMEAQKHGLIKNKI